MERVQKKAAPEAEAPRAHTEHVSEVPATPVQPLHSEEDLHKINRIKESLLSAGMVTIEPLEEDPFVLSREHKNTGEGVTVYTPDGGVTKMSMSNYGAQQAKHRAAAQFFSKNSPEQRASTQSPLPHTASLVSNWLKRIFSSFWSKR